MTRDGIVAATVADLHITNQVPAARMDEPSWFDAMGRSFKQLRTIVESELTGAPVPLLIAGDIFDRFNATPEAINFALKALPDVPTYAIPGNHDLALHNYEDIKKTAYWTLVESGKIQNIVPGKPVEIGNMRVWGFPAGFKVAPVPKSLKHSMILEVALVHSYVWTKDYKHEKAPLAENLVEFADALRTYDVAIFGDNHKGFQAKIEGCRVLNCGTFLRRKMDEKDYQPAVGLIHTSGLVERFFLNTHQDIFTDPAKGGFHPVDHPDFSKIVEELETLGDTLISFPEAIKRRLAEVPPEVKKAVLKAMEPGTK